MKPFFGFINLVFMAETFRVSIVENLLLAIYVSIKTEINKPMNGGLYKLTDMYFSSSKM